MCGFIYEREPRYYTGAIAVNLIVTELVLVAVAVPMAAARAVYPSDGFVRRDAAYPVPAALLSPNQKHLDEL